MFKGIFINYIQFLEKVFVLRKMDETLEHFQALKKHYYRRCFVFFLRDRGTMNSSHTPPAASLILCEVIVYPGESHSADTTSLL